MATNPTPRKLDELIAAGEDLCDGLHMHEAAIGFLENTEALARPELAALILADSRFNAAEAAQVPAYTAERVADSNVKGFIAAFIKTTSITYGKNWSDLWLATGLPDNSVSVPKTKDARFTAMGKIKLFLTDNPAMEVTTPNITVTAALAATRHTALSDARNGVTNALTDTATKKAIRDAAWKVFETRYRNTVDEAGRRMEPDDPRWYDLGLNRPSDPDQPDVPEDVTVTVLGGGRLLARTSGARRANSYNYYKKVIGLDTVPVKVDNTTAQELTIENLPAGATVEITIAGVNDAGEGNPSDPVSVVVT